MPAAIVMMRAMRLYAVERTMIEDSFTPGRRRRDLDEHREAPGRLEVHVERQFLRREGSEDGPRSATRAVLGDERDAHAERFVAFVRHATGIRLPTAR